MATLLLCSYLAMPGGKDQKAKPFSLSEWENLGKKLRDSELKRPEAFFYTSPEEWRTKLGLLDEQVSRIQKLLSRAGHLGIELQRLNSLGIWVTTRSDSLYPAILKRVLKQKCPVILYGAGDIKLFHSEGIAFVGSRDVDESGTQFTEKLSSKCAEIGYTVISGGARGVDTLAQDAALRVGGKVISFIADSLEAKVRLREVREAIMEGKLMILSSEHPKARFSVGSAMNRNKYIYAASKCTIVVSASLEKGGTWAGAKENLKHHWVPMFVRNGEQVPEGNKQLIRMGGIEIADNFLDAEEKTLREHFESSCAKWANMWINQNSNYGKIQEVSQNNHFDLFPVVWPYIQEVLEIPRDEKAIAEMLNVNLKQIREWLNRACEEGEAKRLTKPLRYCLPSKGVGEQCSIFSSTE